ncbi:MAG: SGNH/GDSL hydrolase family protein [Polyangiaceae bacterium]|nr:SGNH/GDSL hydrolase family protein [Polyangiaceae bacterium]
MLKRSKLVTALVATLAGIIGACTSSTSTAVQPGTRGPAMHVRVSDTATERAPAVEPPKALASAAPASEVATAAPASSNVPRSDVATAAVAPPVPTALPIEPRTVVLHVGDSFVMAGFSQTLRPKMKSVGALYEVRAAQASYTTTWHNKLSKLVGDYHPDLVIITLGANEVTLTDPWARADAVGRLVKIVGDTPCVWVTPPLWRKDTGIVDVIKQRAKPCLVFDSDAIAGPISRQPDSIHPDNRGGAVWAEAFWKWLLEHRAPPPIEGEHLPKGSGRHAVNPWRLRAGPSDTDATNPQKTASVAL